LVTQSPEHSTTPINRALFAYNFSFSTLYHEHPCNSTSDCFRQFLHLHKVPYAPLHSRQTFRTFDTLLPSFSFQGIFCFYDCSEDFSNRHTSSRSSFTSSFNSCTSSPTCIFKKLPVHSGLSFALDNSRSTWNYSRAAARDAFGF